MVLGELTLRGDVRPVHGVLAAVGTGLERGIERFVVPRSNLSEAQALGRGAIVGVDSLAEAVKTLREARPETWLAARRRRSAASADSPAGVAADGGLRRPTRPGSAEAGAGDRRGRAPPRAAVRPAGQWQDHGGPAPAGHPAAADRQAGAGGDARAFGRRYPGRGRVADHAAAVPHAAPQRVAGRADRRRPHAAPGGSVAGPRRRAVPRRDAGVPHGAAAGRCASRWSRAR